MLMQAQHLVRLKSIACAFLVSTSNWGIGQLYIKLVIETCFVPIAVNPTDRELISVMFNM